MGAKNLPSRVSTSLCKLLEIKGDFVQRATQKGLTFAPDIVACYGLGNLILFLPTICHGFVMQLNDHQNNKSMQQFAIISPRKAFKSQKVLWQKETICSIMNIHTFTYVKSYMLADIKITLYSESNSFEQYLHECSLQPNTC